jgi:hypothetical protein
MTGLIDFLEARIAEDLVWARQQEKAAIRTHQVSRRLPAPPGHWVRVKRECEAKRRILEECAEAEQFYAANKQADAGELTGLTFVVKVHAAVYADHPDYDQEWRP